MLKQRILFFALMLALGTYAYAAVRFTLFDQAFLAQVQGIHFPYDDIESYTDAADLNALNGGNSYWSGAYVDRVNYLGTQESDDIESYTDGAALASLNGGSGWGGAYADRINSLGTQESDDMESYTDTAALNGLNGGSGWAGAYVDR